MSWGRTSTPAGHGVGHDVLTPSMRLSGLAMTGGSSGARIEAAHGLLDRGGDPGGPGGSGAWPQFFVAAPIPVVSGFTPSAGPAGTLVTIRWGGRDGGHLRSLGRAPDGDRDARGLTETPDPCGGAGQGRTRVRERQVATLGPGVRGPPSHWASTR